MLRRALLIPRRRPFLATTGTVVAGGTVYLTTSEQENIRGVRRQAYFWSKVAPVVADYYWHFGNHPLQVKVEDEGEHKKRLQAIHSKHAPTLLNVMLDLRGLYVKFGQVLSVTMLPVPEVYRDKFRILQSNVSGGPEYDIAAILEQEYGKPVTHVFESFDETPIGAASIGQAHRAVKDGQELVLKIQYPDASWQVPADIQCVNVLLQLCVMAGVVDETASKLSFDDFSRQFLSELDYGIEKQNLQEIYASSLHPSSPYQRRSIVVPKVLEELCTNKVIAMTYISGPKLEEEAHRRLRQLGIMSNGGHNARKMIAEKSTKGGRPVVWGQQLLKLIGLDVALGTVKTAQRFLQGSTRIVANAVSWVPIASWQAWAMEQRKEPPPTSEWVEALLDVHGHQIFQLGLFNADPHPGNILVTPTNHLGLIDFGQCKRLSITERRNVARLILAVCDDDEQGIADAFRGLGMRTRNDNNQFLADFGKLMFGPLQTHHLERAWHQELRKTDHVEFFPTELSMVYRNAMLLRGLAMSLQENPSICNIWREHAVAALENTATEAPIRNDDKSTNAASLSVARRSKLTV